VVWRIKPERHPVEELLKYINCLIEPQRKAFATACGTSESYLRKAISAKQQLGESLCIKIEMHSGGSVTIEMLRPDLAQTLRSAQYVKPTVALEKYIKDGEVAA